MLVPFDLFDALDVFDAFNVADKKRTALSQTVLNI